MNKNGFAFCAILAAASLSTSANAQNLLGTLVKVIGNRATSAPSIVKTSLAPSATVQPSTEQSATMHRLVSDAQAAPQIEPELSAAGPLVEKIVRITACGTNDTAWNQLNRQSVKPQTWDGYTLHVARQFDEYHDPRLCYDLVRLTDFSKPAANALQFTAYYVSPSSQHGSAFRYTIQRDMQGEWLFKDVRTAS